MNTPSTSQTGRRALARQARDAFPPMGVFAIHNLASGCVRVKTSRNVPGAINRMDFELRLGTHPDRLLQTEWNDLGPDRFRVDVLELVKQRVDPAFDYASELVLLEALYTSELASGDHT
jgi:hypothetical protein